MEDFLWELLTERFLNGTLSPDELLAFEQEQATNSEFKEYVTLSKQLKQALGKDAWFTYKNTGEQYETVKKWYQEEDVLAFKEKLQQHANQEFDTEKKVFSLKKYWLPIAAACILLFITIIIQFTAQPSMEELYATYGTWNDTPSFIIQDENTATSKEKIERSYKNGKFADCILLADSFLETAASDRTNVMIYKGFSFVQLHQNEEAIAVFKQISKSNTIDSSKGLWYMALVYLKTEDVENLQQTLKTIAVSDTNYQYSKALQLLDELE